MRLATVSLLLLVAAPLAAQSVQSGDWRIRYDRAGTPDSSLTIAPTNPGFHITTTGRGSAIVWRPSQRATGNFRAEAVTDQLPGTRGAHQEGYGLIVGGNNLDSTSQTYYYFLVRGDGQFTVKHRAGTETHEIMAWTASPAVVKQEGTVAARNTIAVDASRDSLTFLVNGQRVHAIGRPDVDGIVGLRVNHGLAVHLTSLNVTRR